VWAIFVSASLHSIHIFTWHVHMAFQLHLFCLHLFFAYTNEKGS